MSQWDYLFQDDDDTISSAEAMDRAIPRHEPDTFETAQSRQMRTLEDRVAMLELTTEALIRLLEHRGVRREDLALMIQRIDLLDGYEDGQIGPDRSEQAPQCKQCKRPINRVRKKCLFCDAPTTSARESSRPDPTIACSNCAAVVPQRTTYFSEIGAVCANCYDGT